jgi:hypothetical protein
MGGEDMTPEQMLCVAARDNEVEALAALIAKGTNVNYQCPELVGGCTMGGWECGWHQLPAALVSLAGRT